MPRKKITPAVVELEHGPEIRYVAAAYGGRTVAVWQEWPAGKPKQAVWRVREVDPRERPKRRTRHRVVIDASTSTPTINTEPIPQEDQ